MKNMTRKSTDNGITIETPYEKTSITNQYIKTKTTKNHPTPLFQEGKSKTLSIGIVVANRIHFLCYFSDFDCNITLNLLP